ncbi:MAG: DUF3552 domain-containing protein [Bdellovibrionaceae bacterium]|nr:DUF3552 domain-containing protein [Pseudobdellovibrionaceae bacterium]
MNQTIIISISSALGLIFAFLIIRIQRGIQLSMAKNEAKDIIQDAQDRADELSEEAKRNIEHLEEELQENIDKLKESSAVGIEEKKDIVEAKEYTVKKQLSKKKKYLKKLKDHFSNYSGNFSTIEANYKEKKSEVSKLKEQMISQLESVSTEDKSSILLQLVDTLKKDTLTDVTKKTHAQEEEFARESEKKARLALSRVIGRFARAYCPERGINNIIFSSEQNMRRSLGKDFEYVEILETEIGVDLTPHVERLFLNVSGFDPVRRELTRITCDKLSREKRLNPERIKKIIYNSKKQLFKKIKLDGNKILKELRIQNMHPDIRDKIGSLRYRYSFTQNQYFHVSEVGWLCGLLSAELDLDISDGRRAGLLHDVGKSMDHSIDGGHAVIGADFIEKHDEKPHIVHAVRAHHFDEQPQTDLAYLVIAADAISGARPGARKSTAESYTQKMYELEKVGTSFKEVHSTYILSAGREVRVIVDNNKVDDYRALELSKEIATKIEEECTYPGQIRVTVVRKSAAVQYAK